MSDEPKIMTKDQIAKEWALEPLSAADHPTLRFDILIGEQRIKGVDVPFSNFVIGDLGDKAQETARFLTRLLGLTVKIETGEE